MKPASLLFITLLVAAGAPAHTPRPAKDSPLVKQEECSISGIVVKLAGNEPLKSANVRLFNVEDGTRAYGAITDSGGHFALKNVERGRYRMGVTRTGFVAQEYGQKTPNDPGAILTLAPGQEVKDLLFRLIPWSVIAGRIRDEDGEPFPGVQVTALREVYAEGKRKLSPGGQATTNDRGEYRLFGVSPGRYFVSATYFMRFQEPEEVRASEPAEGSTSQEYVPTYYPGTPDPGRASTITVKPGDEIPSVDMILQRVAAYTIRGRIYNAITQRPGKGVSLMMLPRNSKLAWSTFSFDTFVQDKDGSFVLNYVLPGSYTLSAWWFDEGKQYLAKQNIEVGNGDVAGVTLTIAPGMTINGSVIWDGKPGLEGDELNVSAYLTERGYYFGSDARVGLNGAFALKDVPDETYRLSVSGMSKDSYIKAVRYGTTDAIYDGFTVQRGTDASLEVTLSSRGARVQGTVTDADSLPLAGVWVVLIPEEAQRGHTNMYRQTTTDQYGRYELRGIPPGDYKLFSWEEIENGAWQDPEFLKPFEEKGQEVALKEGDQKNANLTAIKTIAPERENP